MTDVLSQFLAQLNNQEEGSWHVLQDAIELFKGEEE